ncbi:hypothetical protein ILUMI_13428 [Ignelater luminosus]|uniref:DDE Tnp4 domain-containing protein n=1 Tax=Ignelater luminosus TaxID=2038154 RepID=A0A8K0CUI6_IGNLU|nr:hypothetical protein ILUMI_13428 [Ignelater luminosus]
MDNLDNMSDNDSDIIISEESSSSSESNLLPPLLKKNEIEQQFRQKGFPGVVEVIDGSHIKIDKPSKDPESYINRKGYIIFQLQAVCDHNMRIRNVYAGYPGSVHDSLVLRTSPLPQTLQEKCQNLYILGDSGYPLLPNLITPFKDGVT